MCAYISHLHWTQDREGCAYKVIFVVVVGVYIKVCVSIFALIIKSTRHRRDALARLHIVFLFLCELRVFLNLLQRSFRSIEKDINVKQHE